MKKDNDFNYNIKPFHMAIVATLATLLTAITSDFGRQDFSYEHGTFPIVGTMLIIIFLLLPIFFKGYRKYIWTKKGLITLFIALIINLPIGIYCTVNHFNIYGQLF